MSTWRDRYDRREFKLIDWERLEPEEQRELLEMLRRDVPKVYDENGMERVERHMRSDDAAATTIHKVWRDAAEILEMGELEAAVEGDPPSDLTVWTQIRASAESLLQEMLISPELTKGSEALSRRQHAADALEYFRNLDFEWSFLRHEMEVEERDWFDEAASSIASKAFMAGRHLQAVSHKEIEHHAVRGVKVRNGAKAGAERTRRLRNPDMAKRIERMASLVPKLGVSGAAAQCERDGLGSQAAVRNSWYRHRRKKL